MEDQKVTRSRRVENRRQLSNTGTAQDQDTLFNTLRPRQNGRHFPDDIFKCIFLNEKVLILIKISLKLIPKGSINNIPALVQIMAWRRPGDKPLSEPMMVFRRIYASLGLNELNCDLKRPLEIRRSLVNWSRSSDSRTRTCWMGSMPLAPK